MTIPATVQTHDAGAPMALRKAFPDALPRAFDAHRQATA